MVKFSKKKVHKKYSKKNKGGKPLHQNQSVRICNHCKHENVCTKDPDNNKFYCNKCREKWEAHPKVCNICGDPAHIKHFGNNNFYCNECWVTVFGLIYDNVSTDVIPKPGKPYKPRKFGNFDYGKEIYGHF